MMAIEKFNRNQELDVNLSNGCNPVEWREKACGRS
jgi:hypothetical protein